MGFRFRLDPVMRHRRHVEQERTLTWARALRLRDLAARRLEALREEAGAGREALLAASRRGTTGLAVTQMARGVAASVTLSRGAGAELGTAGARLDTARVALVEASQDRRALERLEAAKRLAHARRVRVQEQKALDDLASARAARAVTARPERDRGARPAGGAAS